MTVRRTAIVVAPLALLALTACGDLHKPAPQVTLATEGRVVNVDATRYCFKADKCRDHKTDPHEIRVRPSGTISINVPSRVAHAGWYFRAGGQTFGKATKKLHNSFELPANLPAEADFEIIQGEPNQPPQGIWNVHLVLKR